MVRGRSLLRMAGVVAWLFAGVPAMHAICLDASREHPLLLAAWIGSFVVFGAAFWKSSAALGRRSVTRGLVALLALQTLAAIGMLTCWCSGFEAALLAVVGAQLGLLLPVRVGLPWLLAQSAALWLVASKHWGSERHFATWALGVMGFGIFGYILATIAQRELRARAELARSNAELRATRELLELGSKSAERLRIARELHDLVGHDLVALNLHLETARHLASKDSGEALAPVELAQSAAKKLLGDVRVAVSRLRDERAIDVAGAVAVLVDGLTAPRIHLSIADRLPIHDPERAHAVVRCVQEIVTNTMKHAAADNLWIGISVMDGELVLRARDDGRGARSLCEGNGLTGMRERLADLGGRLSLDGSGGFTLEARMPLGEGRS